MMTVFDVTRDLQGFFYAKGNWRDKYNLMKEKLEENLGIEFANNGNSFNTCFQFVEKQDDNKIYRRIKVYNKTIALFQSAGPRSGIGMNTNMLFAPQQPMLNSIRKTEEEGMTRIEISYYSDSREACKGYFAEDFTDLI